MALIRSVPPLLLASEVVCPWWAALFRFTESCQLQFTGSQGEACCSLRLLGCWRLRSRLEGHQADFFTLSTLPRNPLLFSHPFLCSMRFLVNRSLTHFPLSGTSRCRSSICAAQKARCLDSSPTRKALFPTPVCGSRDASGGRRIASTSGLSHFRPVCYARGCMMGLAENVRNVGNAGIARSAWVMRASLSNGRV